ncbi:ester cyclase [Streptomyces sp. NPDC058470]|uniref:ester cyclase n=1 Tax=Streptomyces sp. NPDC058470 TaxID=3346515 RepID=UPI00364FC289
MTDGPRVIGQRIYTAFNTRDLAAVETIFAADFVSHPLGTTGPDAVTRSWSKMIATYPDIHVVVEDMLVDRDRVAVRSTLHGLPAGAGDQHAPTMMEIFRVQGGRIAELWGLSSLTRPGR